MNDQFEIRIVKHDVIEDYAKKPFSLFIDDKEVEGVKRFSIDLDKTKLAERKPYGESGESITLNDLTYTIEYCRDAYEGMTSRHTNQTSPQSGWNLLGLGELGSRIKALEEKQEGLITRVVAIEKRHEEDDEFLARFGSKDS